MLGRNEHSKLLWGGIAAQALRLGCAARGNIPPHQNIAMQKKVVIYDRRRMRHQKRNVERFLVRPRTDNLA